ncbi:MAG: D-tyrosyl-tRNA(Tyr) deacylase [Bacteroidales bacterium]|nr:D-tyrosyl-tRNA(Tyr) deacylase [Bacteroidales bacterium]MBQ2913880.1 D-tyrosyl-tRNA(Tyr) deacylase [Bacteroidales bacterium]MBQ7019122.1 D-tyrosyl-tRNA(Tyr) deacylase [Bacteroidales bacterium]MBR2477351.1 D-tyrosyl-tRNA(Tyr) deacylase [Bacteroidales bacterium]
MRTVIQRVVESSVAVAPQEGMERSEVIGKIGKGMMVLVGIEAADDDTDIAWLSKKIVNLRIFDDAQGVMNLSIKDAGGDILLISQFTLQAATAKGNRPSYIKAAPPAIAIPIYEKFIKQLENDLGKGIQTGRFGADMKVNIVNDGPVTILIDSKNRE